MGTVRSIGVIRPAARPAPLAARVLGTRASFVSAVTGRAARTPVVGARQPGPWRPLGVVHAPLARGAAPEDAGDPALSPRFVGRMAAAVARWLAPGGMLASARVAPPAPAVRDALPSTGARALEFARRVAERAAPAAAPARPAARGAAQPVRFDHPGRPAGIPDGAVPSAFDPAAAMRRAAERRGGDAPVREAPARVDVVPGAPLPPTVRVRAAEDAIASPVARAEGRAAVERSAPRIDLLRPALPGEAPVPPRGEDAPRAPGRPLPPPGVPAEGMAPAAPAARRARTAGDAAADGARSASVPPVTGARPVRSARDAAPILPATEAAPIVPAAQGAPLVPVVHPTRGASSPAPADAAGPPPSAMVHLARPAAPEPGEGAEPSRRARQDESAEPAVVRPTRTDAMPAEMQTPAPDVVRPAAGRPSAAEGTAREGVPASAWLSPAAALMRALGAAERAAAASAEAPAARAEEGRAPAARPTGAPGMLPATAAVAAPGAVRPMESAAAQAVALARRIADRAAPSQHPAARPGGRPEAITFPGLPGSVVLPSARQAAEAEAQRTVERVLGRFEAPRAEPAPAAPAEADAPRMRAGRAVGQGEAAPAQEHAPVAVGPSIGFALPARLREGMRALLGFDPGSARIHTGDAAGRAARRLGAAAFTVGSDVFFAPGRYAPETRGGLALLAHELAHVRQQPLGRAFAAGELTPARRAALEAEARGAEARVQAPRTALSTAAAWPPLAVSFAPLAAPAAPMLAEESSAPAADAPAAAAPAAAGSQPGAAAPAAGAGAEAIAEEVYRMIRERMRIDRERRGIQPWA